MDPSETWDGKPISKDKPYGASVVVFRTSENGLELLMLHRGHLGIDEGPWAWTPPSGARVPGESIEACAKRELLEEAGIALPLKPTNSGTEDWFVYIAEAPHNVVIVLDSEHDRFEWLSTSDALSRCQPEVPHQILCAAVECLRGLSDNIWVFKV